jgi:hypothetical protein
MSHRWGRGDCEELGLRRQQQMHAAGKLAYVFRVVSPPARHPSILQDTNLAQFELLRLLIGPKNHLFAVGDPNQVCLMRERGGRERSDVAASIPTHSTASLHPTGLIRPNSPLINSSFNPAHHPIQSRSNPIQPRQGIYYFRGSDPSNLTCADRDWPGLATVYLKDNYR